MKKTCYLLGALVLANCALFTVNKYQGWRAKKPAVSLVSQVTVSPPVSGEQMNSRTFTVSGRISASVE